MPISVKDLISVLQGLPDDAEIQIAMEEVPEKENHPYLRTIFNPNTVNYNYTHNTVRPVGTVCLNFSYETRGA